MSTNARQTIDLTSIERELEAQDRTLDELLAASRCDEVTLTVPQADLDALKEVCARPRVASVPRATGIRC